MALQEDMTAFAVGLDQAHAPGVYWEYNNAAVQTLLPKYVWRPSISLKPSLKSGFGSQSACNLTALIFSVMMMPLSFVNVFNMVV